MSREALFMPLIIAVCASVPRQQALRSTGNVLQIEITDTASSIFEATNIYQSGTRNSYTQLTSNPTILKKHIQSLHMMVYDGDILPELDQLGLNSIYHIDTEIKILQKDISAQNTYKTWMNSSKDLDTKMHSTFSTTSSFNITRINLGAVKNRHNETNAIAVNVEQLHGFVLLQINTHGKIKKFEALDSTKNIKILHSPKAFTNFNINEYQLHRNLTIMFWNALGISGPTKVLNTGNDIYKQLEIEIDREIDGFHQASNKSDFTHISGVCSKNDSQGEGCAVFVAENGTVHSVLPNKLIPIYKDLNSRNASLISQLLRSYLRKLGAGKRDTVQLKTVGSIVQLETLHQHVKLSVSSDNENMDDRTPLNVLGHVIGDQLNSDIKLRLSVLHAVESLLGDVHTNKPIARNFEPWDARGGFWCWLVLTSGLCSSDPGVLVLSGARLVLTLKGWDIAAMSSTGAAKIGNLGRVLGGLGGTIDVVLGLYNLVGASKKRDAAILSGSGIEIFNANQDVNAEKLRIALGAAIIVTAVAFAPASLAVGIGSLVIKQFTKYRNDEIRNELVAIQEQIPLPGYLLAMEGERRFWTLCPEPNYIDDLLAEHLANNGEVNEMVKFLQKYQNYSGIIFPSLIGYAENSCELTHITCGGTIFNVCVTKSDERRDAKGCNLNERCPGSDKICFNFQTQSKSFPTFSEIRDMGTGVFISGAVSFVGLFSSGPYTTYSCNCGNINPPVQRKHSIVDFRNTMDVYLDIAAPSPVDNAEFICKQSRVKAESPMFSNLESTRGYLCQNANGLLKPSHLRNDDQILLIDLKDGEDEVYLNPNDKTPTRFIITGGKKTLVGGGGEDTFYFPGSVTNGNCEDLSGYLTGNTGVDTIHIGSSACHFGYVIFYSTHGPQVQYLFGTRLTMNVSHIDVLRGKLPGKYLLYGLCGIKSVEFTAGGNGYGDGINLINFDSDCEVNTDIFMGGKTHIAGGVRRGRVSFYVSKAFTIHFNNTIYSNTSTDIAFLDTSSIEVRPEKETEDGAFSLKTEKGDVVYFRFKYDPPNNKSWEPQIFFFEGESQYSMLRLAPDNRRAHEFHYNLPSNASAVQSRTRLGNKYLGNVFDILEPGWSATGGDVSDEFILHVADFGVLDGGDGDDKITLDSDLKANVYIDFLDTSKFKAIEKIIDRSGRSSLSAVVACDTKLVSTMGGPANKPDIVKIQTFGECSKRNLQIILRGHSSIHFYPTVYWEPTVGNLVADKTTVVLLTSMDLKMRDMARIWVDMRRLSHDKISNVRVIVKLKNDVWRWKESRKLNDLDLKHQIVNIVFVDDGNGKIKFSVPSDASTLTAAKHIDLRIVKEHENEFQVPLIVDDYSPFQVRAYYHLMKNDSIKNSSVTTITGFPHMSNIFQVAGGSYVCVGGNLEDTFNVVLNLGEHVSIYGYPQKGHDSTVKQEKNTLFLENNVKESNEAKIHLVINLQKEQIGFANSSAGKLKSIQNIHGRVNQPDYIHTSCDTEYVAGGGGLGKNQTDAIFISHCKGGGRELIVDVGSFTILTNTATTGKFIYNVSDLDTTALLFTSVTNISHSITYAISISEVINRVQFDQQNLHINFTQGKDKTKVHSIKMGPLQRSEYFSGPQLAFQEPGTSVVTELKVKKLGTLEVIFNVLSGIWSHKNPNKLHGVGVGVNQFLLDIDNKNEDGGSIEGSSESERNYFWIRKLEARLDLLSGGNCGSSITNKTCINSLHLDENLKTRGSIHVELKDVGGKIKMDGGNELISKVQNINEIYGRKSGDSVHVASCGIKRLAGFQNITLLQSKCNFNLTLDVDLYTTVLFEEEKEKDRKLNLNDSFTYRFSVSRTFDLTGEELAWLGSNHNYLLPLTLSKMDMLRFSMKTKRLFFRMTGEAEHSIGMISGAGPSENFFAQPLILTRDNFVLKVDRLGFITLTSVNASSPTGSMDIRKQIIPAFEKTANKLGAQIVIQTNKDFFHFGHDKTKVKHRHIFENIPTKRSHLVANANDGVEDDTIYSVKALQQDVVIYTGFSKNLNCSESQRHRENGALQTLDISDVIVQIRNSTGTKYVPDVVHDKTDLVIQLSKYKDKYPGKVIIVNGTSPCVHKNIQIMLNVALMSFKEGKKKGTWKIIPNPIHIPKGYVYNIAAEELEEGHVIVKSDDHENMGRANDKLGERDHFELTQNINDLHMTNLGQFAQNGSTDIDREITTVIINDFYMKENLAIGGRSEAGPGTPPSSVKNVTVNLPGLSLTLNGTSIFRANGTRSILVDKDDIKEWQNLVHSVAEDIVKELSGIPNPFLERICRDPHPGHLCHNHHENE